MTNPTGIFVRLRALLAYEPALAAWATNGGLALILAYLVHLNTVQEAAVTTIATALAAIWTASAARPVAVSALVGALATAVTAAGAFGLHLPAPVLAAGVSLLSSVLAVLFRANLTPAARLPKPEGLRHLTA